MNIPIIIRTFVQQLRDKSTYIYFLLFPLSLMLILGTILQGAFSTDIESKIETVDVQYVVENEELGHQFELAVKESSPDKISFEKSPSAKVATEAMEKKKTDAYINIAEEIDVQTGNLSELQYTLLKSYLVEVFQVIHFVQGAQQFNTSPQEILGGTAKLDDVIGVDQTNLKKSANSYQYYSIAMIALFILYMSESGLEMFGKSRRQHILQRELISPLSRQKIINSTFTGHALLGFCVVLTLMLLTQLLFRVPWHQQFIFSFLSLSSLMLLFLVLGSFLETIGKDVGSGLTQILIQVAAFLGGGYFPVSEGMANFSPMGWIMGPLREALWTNNPLQWRGILLNLFAAGILYVGMSIVLNKREEF